MQLAMIPIKYTYAKKGDIVLRSYVRVIEQTGINFLISKKPQLDDAEAFVVCEVNDDGVLIEYFTGRIVPSVQCRYATANEMDQIQRLSLEQIDLLKKIMKSCLFGEHEDLEFKISTMEEDATDRTIESRAYDDGLSDIDPYDGDYMAYNNFLLKAKLAINGGPTASRKHFIDELYYHTLAFNRVSTSPLNGLADQDLKLSDSGRNK